MATAQEITKYASSVVPNVWGKIVTTGTIKEDTVNGNTRTIKGKLNNSSLTKDERKLVMKYGEPCAYAFVSDFNWGGPITQDKFATERQITFSKNGRTIVVKIFKTMYTDFNFTVIVTK
jgi:hypothetical protein